MTESDLEEEKLREALARHAQCWEKDEADPSVAAAGVKKALASRSEVATLGRVEAAWSSLEEYFALNVSIERVFRDFRGRFKSGPAHLVTAELVAGLNPPEFKTKVAPAFDMKGCWKEHPDLVYLIAREAAEAWTTVVQVDKLRRVKSRPKRAVARVCCCFVVYLTLTDPLRIQPWSQWLICGETGLLLVSACRDLCEKCSLCDMVGRL